MTHLEPGGGSEGLKTGAKTVELKVEADKSEAECRWSAVILRSLRSAFGDSLLHRRSAGSGPDLCGMLNSYKN